MSATLISDKLKETLLQSAIQGKLTQQRLEDGDARDLLKQIESEKKRLINEKVIKKEKSLPEITQDEIPFDIPDNWSWVRLGNYIRFIDYRGMTPHKINSGIRLITASNIKKGHIDLSSEDYISTREYKLRLTRGTTKKGDVLFTTEAPLGHCCINPFEIASCGQRIITFQNFGEINADNVYLMYTLNTPFFQKFILDNRSGITAKGIKASTLKLLLLPVPPIEEQHRIVEVIETVLAKIDKLEADEKKLYDIQRTFPNKLRSSLLQSAIQGKLTQQRAEDGNARDLLKQIEAEKERLVNEKVVKKEKLLPKITQNDIPFDIPANWVWVRLGDVTIINPKNKVNDDFNAAFIPMTYIRDGYRNEFVYANEKWKAIKKGFTHFADNDLIIAKITPCFQNRKSVVLRHLPNGFGAGTTELHVIRVINNLINPLYLLFLSKSNKFIDDGIANFTGTAGQQRIGKDFISNYLLPLPPLAEQHLIVEAIETVLAKIDKLCKLTEC